LLAWLVIYLAVWGLHIAGPTRHIFSVHRDAFTARNNAILLAEECAEVLLS